MNWGKLQRVVKHEAYKHLVCTGYTKKSIHLRQIRAVGIVTQTGAYFFLASGVPGFGSSATATLAMDHAAAAAAAVDTKSLLPLPLLCFTCISYLDCSPSESEEALATTRPRRAVAGGLVVVVMVENEAEPLRNEGAVVDGIVIEAI